MGTTERATPSVGGRPPPTTAEAGETSSASAAIGRKRFLIGAAIARNTGIAKRRIGLVPVIISC
jgi:hypothetical protein